MHLKEIQNTSEKELEKFTENICVNAHCFYLVNPGHVFCTVCLYGSVYLATEEQRAAKVQLQKLQNSK